MAARPTVNVRGVDGAATGSLPLPAVFTAPIRPDVVEAIHCKCDKRRRCAHAPMCVDALNFPLTICISMGVWLPVSPIFLRTNLLTLPSQPREEQASALRRLVQGWPPDFG